MADHRAVVLDMRREPADGPVDEPVESTKAARRADWVRRDGVVRS